MGEATANNAKAKRFLRRAQRDVAAVRRELRDAPRRG